MGNGQDYEVSDSERKHILISYDFVTWSGVRFSFEIETFTTQRPGQLK